MQKPSDRKELGFSRKGGSLVTISESLRVRMEGGAPAVGLAAVLRDVQEAWSSV